MSVAIQVARKAQLESSESLTDGGVLHVTSLLTALSDGDCPEDYTSEMIEGLLAAVGEVRQTEKLTTYEWVYCPPPDGPRWKFFCLEDTGLEINDGGTSPIQVQLTVKRPYPSS